MAYKPSPNSLIHCSQCGEDYSATYKRCPFCGARNAPPPPPDPRPPRATPVEEPDPQPESDQPAAPADLEDTYVFDGQDMFDDPDEDDYASAHPRGGKRLAEKSSSKPFAGAEINWPRMITFICSLVIIVAAMIIVFTVVYPQLRGNDNPSADSTGSPSATAPGGDATSTVDPSASSSGTEPSSDIPWADPNDLTTIFFGNEDDADFSLLPGESRTIELVFDPADWSGAVTWTSSDPTCATVDADGTVINVNATNQLLTAYITASVGDLSIQSKVSCSGVTSTEPPVTDTPASEPPSTQPPVSGGSTVGRPGTIVNADSGLNVRSGPGISYDRIGSLFNGQSVNVLEDAGNGWYKISYAGSNGTAEGYVSSDFISLN